MPYVNIVYGRGSYREQKVERSTRIPSEVLGENPATTEVVVDEVPTENWGAGGELVGARSSRERVTQADRRARR